MKKFCKNEIVFVDFQDGERSSENYTGAGVFMRYLKQDESGYEHLEQPHALVKIGPKEKAVFPLRSITSKA